MIEFILIFLLCLFSGQVSVVLPDEQEFVYMLKWPCEPGQLIEDQETCWLLLLPNGQIETGP